MPADASVDTASFDAVLAKDIKVPKFINNVMSNLVIDTKASSAAFTSRAEIHPKSEDWYSAEQAWTLYFNVDGSKVKNVIELCDKDAIMKMVNEPDAAGLARMTIRVG